MGQDWFGDWRAQRIRALLAMRSAHTVASFTAMQADPVSAFAEAVLPRLLRTPPADAASRQALAALKRWDGAMRPDWWQRLLFNDWMARFEAALLRQQQVEPFVEGAEADMIARTLGPDEARWCGPGCDEMLSRTLAQAAAAHGMDDRWGPVHQAEFAHPLLGRLPLIGPLFTWRAEQPGDATTVFAGAPRSLGLAGAADWTSVHGPAFRGVYDLADLDRSVFALAPGQSGNPLSPHAADLMRSWRSGDSLRLGPNGKADDTIELTP